MDTRVVYDQNRQPNVEFVTEADWIPSFWNFLLDLDPQDLVAELVQNDLDQDATRTVISFEKNQLVSEGNGKPVTPERNLSTTMGHSTGLIREQCPVW